MRWSEVKRGIHGISSPLLSKNGLQSVKPEKLFGSVRFIRINWYKSHEKCYIGKTIKEPSMCS